MDVYTCKKCKLSEWMANRKGSKLTAPGAAIHLDLLSKAQGVEQAEQYFNSLPDDVKTQEAPSLQCSFEFLCSHKISRKSRSYCRENEAIAYDDNTSYNFILNLYKKIGDYEKLDKIHQEMLEIGVLCD
ncbi:putative pentatricopeptide [Helianthus anomalus]